MLKLSTITYCVYTGFNARPLQYNTLRIQNGGWVIGASQLVQDGQEHMGNPGPAKDTNCKCFKSQQEIIKYYSSSDHKCVLYSLIVTVSISYLGHSLLLYCSLKKCHKSITLLDIVRLTLKNLFLQF